MITLETIFWVTSNTRKSDHLGFGVLGCFRAHGGGDTWRVSLDIWTSGCKWLQVSIFFHDSEVWLPKFLRWSLLFRIDEPLMTFCLVVVACHLTSSSGNLRDVTMASSGATTGLLALAKSRELHPAVQVERNGLKFRFWRQQQRHPCEYQLRSVHKPSSLSMTSWHPSCTDRFRSSGWCKNWFSYLLLAVVINNICILQ